MTNSIFNKDFVDFVHALNKHEVKYILVGGYSVIVHGYNRTTGDLDLWVEPTKENYSKLQLAFHSFGLPTNSIEASDFLDTQRVDVFSFGRPPVSIDVMTKVKGLDFESTFESSNIHKIDDLAVRVISIPKLREAKKAAGRNKDLDDLENLPQE